MQHVERAAGREIGQHLLDGGQLLRQLRNRGARIGRHLEAKTTRRRHAGVVPRVLWHTTNADRATVIERLAAETRGPPGLHVTTGLLPEPERRNP